MDKVKDEINETMDHITEAAQKLKNAMQELTEKTIGNNPTAHHATALPTPQNAMYASITQQHMPTALATVVTRGETTDKQMLIQIDLNNTDNTLKDLTEKELVAKVNTTLNLMGIEATDHPAHTAIIGAKKLRNSNILYQLNTQEAAIWFRQPDVKHTFTAKFNGISNIQDKLFYVIAEFVPTTFEAGTSFTHARIEEDSALTEKTITYSKYIKPPHLHSTNQKVAHVIFSFNDRNSANRVIEYGMYIEGKEIKVCKCLSEPRRCLNASTMATTFQTAKTTPTLV
jgi:hypothetical protein